MATDSIRYDLLVQEALKGVVRRVLTDATRDGLPGEHHFYISFRTDRSGVRISPRLREKYPEDMTIVLQHQFSGLAVNDQAFEVGLSFSGVSERLRIPFDALTGFFDPSVQFGLKFETDAAEATDDASVAGTIPQIGTRKAPVAIEPEKTDEPAGAEAASEAPEGSAEVVSLDAFRKKN